MIHYHGTPFSGDESVKTAMVGRHACVSFANAREVETVAEVCQSFILDNGAFTAWKQGTTYDDAAYCNFVTKWYRHPGCDWWMIPDIIDGTEDDNRNRIENFGMGLDGATPVWHLHESLEWLEELSKGYTRVCLGSSGSYATIGTNRWWSRMAETMDTLCDEGIPRCKIHGLRMLDPTVFSYFPFSSADSTNVARNIGIDSAWTNSAYAPKSRKMRALIMMERIESHASASTWSGRSVGVQRNLDLIG